MKYVRLKTTDPYYNLAAEEYLFRNSSDDVFMLWQNEPSVIIGKNQNIYAEADLDYARENGIKLCRRITGGGAVYHDLGNVNYTFISKSGERALDFEYFTKPIRRALSELGLAAKLSGRNDIECLGAKISGNAQHAEAGRILHHGTLLFDTDGDVMSSVLRVDREKLAYRAVKSCKARVANIKELLCASISLEEFIRGIEANVCEMLGAEPLDITPCDEIDKIYQRNKSDEWIYSEKRYLTSYAAERKKKYPYGLVKAELEYSGALISKIVISGDFFGTAPIEELEAKLVGKAPKAALEINPAPFISGMTPRELYELIKQ